MSGCLVRWVMKRVGTSAIAYVVLLPWRRDMRAFGVRKSSVVRVWWKVGSRIAVSSVRGQDQDMRLLEAGVWLVALALPRSTSPVTLSRARPWRSASSCASSACSARSRWFEQVSRLAAAFAALALAHCPSLRPGEAVVQRLDWSILAESVGRRSVQPSSFVVGRMVESRLR